ncbi:SDR family oxidoreductase [Shewanella sp. MBTL60-007]|uniref:dTDP-4-dehydrorhamnose reductase family protein n=1 Tax=Shewanella sp. MBTL60-007 TaxID=2815911 RepID=UPI001C8239E9|nr:SDR family oxidoreductase [Shewanella sp. MBTL60-007]
MAKIMVTGATGLLGRALIKQLAQHIEHQIIACGYSRTSPSIERLDLTQAAQVSAFVAKHKPDIILHCAAERRPDVSEQDPQGALALNSDATQFLTRAASQYGAWLLYISTDYVFDGCQPPYREDAEPNPVNFYGQSKLLGEQVVSDAQQGFAILRLPILYGEVESLNESAVMVLLELLADTAEQPVDNWAIRSPTSTADVATAIAKMVTLKLAGETLEGHYHFSAKETMSKYQMLLAMAEVQGLTTGHLIPVTSPTDSAKRPKDSSLSCERLVSLGIESKVPFKIGFKRALQDSPCAAAYLKVDNVRR